MIALEHKGFFPLTTSSIDALAPRMAGVYTLAISHQHGVHKTFFTRGSEDLYQSLLRLSKGDYTELSPDAFGYVKTYQCYFTYFVVPDAEQREAVTKIFSLTLDPIVQLTVTSCS